MAFDMKDRLGQLKHVVSRIGSISFTIKTAGHTVVICIQNTTPTIPCLVFIAKGCYCASIIIRRPH